jgi:hypothetical protein
MYMFECMKFNVVVCSIVNQRRRTCIIDVMKNVRHTNIILRSILLNTMSSNNPITTFDMNYDEAIGVSEHCRSLFHCHEHTFQE